MLLEERIIGVETGACPHTAVREDPSMNLAAVEDMEARFPDTDVVLIESGGDNLTLTFSPALVDFFIYVIDVAAGDKIPRKNGPGISQVRHPRHQQDRPRAVRRRQPRGHGATTPRLMRGAKPFVFTNCKTGEGIDDARRADPRTNVLFDAVIEPTLARCSRQRRSWRLTRTSRRSCRSGAPGKNGVLRLGFERRGDRTRWSTCTAARRCWSSRRCTGTRSMPGPPLRLHHLHTPAASLQGDRYAVEIDARPPAPRRM